LKTSVFLGTFNRMVPPDPGRGTDVPLAWTPS